MWGDVRLSAGLAWEERRRTPEVLHWVHVRWIAYQWARRARFDRLAAFGKIIHADPGT
ncbi:hypothetical protein HNR10_001272 [Nocardiopsis aegyptia]|uniref:Uncharacterized protein n=1 Tax=Nocardiopsis aegyptia TaxID=220378 RepID=A0A7Z0J8W0_9ACTN|nr:hypothetical protein [Nocardiopsis aegyptia]